MAAGAIGTGIVLAAYHLDTPLRTGETMTITSYATQSFAVAMTKYDQPNNHLLHTLLVWVAHQFGGWHRIVLRMPAFLSFCLFLPLLWWFVRKEYGSATALFATALAATSPVFLGYAIQARGYTLLLLLFVTALLCARALVRSPGKTALWAAWAAAISLGLYTIPVMVFPAALVVAWMLLLRWRRSSTDGYRQFAARTVAWSTVAFLAAGALYLPVFLAEGPEGAQKILLTTRTELTMGRLRIVGHPVVLWRDWHFTTPTWIQGALLALVVVGAAARGRSCKRKGTLLLATGLAWVLVLAAYPLLKEFRYYLWALLVCMIMAGAGAALVLDRTVALTSARWPGVVAAPRRRILECVGLALVLASFSWLATRSDAIRRAASHSPPRRSLPATVSSVVGRMAPGDWFAVCHGYGLNALVQVRADHAVEPNAGWYAPVANLPQRMDAHRVSAFAGPAARQRLYWFDHLDNEGESLCTRVAPGRRLLEAQWPDHELVASFGMGKSGGASRAYMLNDWSPGRP